MNTYPAAPKLHRYQSFHVQISTHRRPLSYTGRLLDNYEKSRKKQFQNDLQSMPYLQIYTLLSNHFGPQGWWPGDSPLEIMVGALLTQNTNWENVRKAINNLKNSDVLSFSALSSLPEPDLAHLIRPSGYFNIKAKRLKNLLQMIHERYDGELTHFLADDLTHAREALLSVKGIGPETADSILLYAACHPIFVVDAYTHRIFSRHHLTLEEIDYHSLQEEFHGRLPADPALYNEYHALIVALAKNYCRKTKPKCAQCPLQGL